MGTQKTDDDIRREDIAHAINGSLIGTGVSVSPGSDGGFVVSVKVSDEAELNRIVAVMLRETV